MSLSFLQQNRFFQHFTLRLGLSVGLIALSTLNYGFDNQGIATSQAMIPYKKQFGEYNPETKTYAIPAYFLSLLNSLNFIGFAFGTSRWAFVESKSSRLISRLMPALKGFILEALSVLAMVAGWPCSACRSGP
jgi:SP family sugar:H+ symporter-like MFS transporter